MEEAGIRGIQRLHDGLEVLQAISCRLAKTVVMISPLMVLMQDQLARKSVRPIHCEQPGVLSTVRHVRRGHSGRIDGASEGQQLEADSRS